MAKGYTQVFGQRKAVKYRKYADDLLTDYARNEDREKGALILHARDTLRRLADMCDPPGIVDPFDGL